MTTKVRNTGHTYLQWTFALFASVTVLIQGIDNGWISPVAKHLQSDASPTGHSISNEELNWIVSSMSLSAIFSVPVYAYLVDAFGRRLGVIFLAIPQTLSWIIRLSYSSTPTLIIARVLSGLAAGGCFNIVPIYIKEISQDDVRGILGTLPTLFQTLGIFFVYIIGAYVNYFVMNCIILILPIATILLMLKAPESPAYLVKQGKINESINTVALLRGLNKHGKEVENIVQEMKKEEDYYRSLPNMTLLYILQQRSWRKAFVILMLAFTFFELNGALIIVTYASKILSITAIEFNVRPEIQALSFPIVMTIGSVMVATCVERVGRKPLLIIAFVVSSFSMFCVATMMMMQRNGSSVLPWLPVLVMIVAVFMFSGGVMPLTYIIMTEMLNFQIRAKVMGLIVTYSWFLTFWLFNLYALLSNNLGTHSAFLFYGIINLAGAIFSSLYLPETKGKTEDEILEMLTKDTTLGNNNTASHIQQGIE